MAMARHRHELVCIALHMAIVQRWLWAGLRIYLSWGKPCCTGVQHQALLDKHGLAGSMSCKGNCHDNAVMARFFLKLNMKRDWQKDYANYAGAIMDIDDHRVNLYITIRPHSKLGNLSSNAFERESASQHPLELAKKTRPPQSLEFTQIATATGIDRQHDSL